MPEAIIESAPVSTPIGGGTGTEIRVSGLPSTGMKGPVRPGSARERIFRDIEKKGGATLPSAKPSAPPAKAKAPANTEPAKPDAAPQAKPDSAKPGEGQSPERDGAKPGETPVPGDAAQVTPPADKGKQNPWKIVDSYKAKVRDLETKLAETEKRAVPEATIKETQTRLEKAEARAKELESELVYHEGRKYDPEYLKLEKDYNSTFERATRELGQIQILDEKTQQPRQFGAQDLLELVNTPLSKDLVEELEQKFGATMAGYVIERRNKIREIFEQQQSRLDELKTTGATRAQERAKQLQQEQESVAKEVTSTWTQANEEAQRNEKYGSYFTPVEGDQEGNQRLAKGFELADRAFRENPMAPGLTPDQRKDIVRRHAAVRNRCAAFGRLVYQLTGAQSKIAQLEKELAGFKGSEPGSAQPKPEGSAPIVGSAKDRLHAALGKIAH